MKAHVNATRRLWTSLAVLLLASFGVLLWIGAEIKRGNVFANNPTRPQSTTSQQGALRDGHAGHPCVGPGSPESGLSRVNIKRR